MTTKDRFYKQVLTDAFAKPVAPERAIGCCRVYVTIGDKAQAKDIGKAAKALGKIWQTKGHQYLRNVLYIGYDNCDGNALARGTQVAEYLQGHGVKCWREEIGD